MSTRAAATRIGMLVAAVAIGCAACGGATTVASEGGYHVVGLTGRTGSATSPGGHQAGVVIAKRLLSEAPQIAGETVTTTVPNSLKQAWERPSARNIVTLTRYWTVPMSQREAYRRLKAARVSHLRLALASPHGAGPAGELSYAPMHRPAAADLADDSVEVRQQSDGSTTIAAFAQVVPYPVRAAAERIDLERVGGTLRRTRLDPGSEKPVARPRTVTLTSGQARAVTRLLNQLPVEPPWTCTGPFPADRFRLVLRSSGTTWTMHFPGTCGAVDVRHGSEADRPLAAKAGIWHLLAIDMRSRVRAAR